MAKIYMLFETRRKGILQGYIKKKREKYALENKNERQEAESTLPTQRPTCSFAVDKANMNSTSVPGTGR